MLTTPRTIRSTFGMGLLLALAVVFASAALADSSVSGNCVSANVEEPVLLPTGDLHAAGRLTVCITRHFTPVTTLHKTYVNGKLIGLLRSRRGESEGSADRPFMMFNRDGEGRLHLFGYAMPAGSRMTTYQLGVGRPQASSMARGATAAAGNLVLMASTTSGPR